MQPPGSAYIGCAQLPAEEGKRGGGGRGGVGWGVSHWQPIDCQLRSKDLQLSLATNPIKAALRCSFPSAERLNPRCWSLRSDFCRASIQTRSGLTHLSLMSKHLIFSYYFIFFITKVSNSVCFMYTFTAPPPKKTAETFQVHFGGVLIFWFPFRSLHLIWFPHLRHVIWFYHKRNTSGVWRWSVWSRLVVLSPPPLLTRNRLQICRFGNLIKHLSGNKSR